MRTSLWRWIGSCSSFIAGNSGKKCAAKPVSTKNHKPKLGNSVTIKRSSSLRMRSGDTILSRSCMLFTASTSSATGSSLSVEINRAARIIRNGSSLKLSVGESGVRNTRAIRSVAPPYGSTSTGCSAVTSSAMALTVKSRRDKSVLISRENCTSGLRESGEYASAR